MKISISGATGKMGIALLDVLEKNKERFNLVSKITSSTSLADLKNSCEQSDVIIDFSTPAALENLLEQAVFAGTNLVIGTTGYEEKHFLMLEKAANKIAILYTANTSLGANLVANLAAKAAAILKNYDIEILDFHHKYKKDAPSGTSIMIAEKIASDCNFNLKEKAVFDRASKGLRSDGEIGFASLRGGGVFGKHDVIFAGQNEIVSIEHVALNRAAFADGALVAANWITGKKPGIYSMQDLFDNSQEIL